MGREGVTGRFRSPRTRIPLPAAVDFPTDVLRELRRMHPHLDGMVLPDGRVWIVMYREDRPRIQTGRAALALAKVMDWTPHRSDVLMAHGFELLAELPYARGTSAGYLHRYLAPILRATERDAEAAMRRHRAVADHSVKREEMLGVLKERIRAYARTDWARTYKGRKVFGRETTGAIST